MKRIFIFALLLLTFRVSAVTITITASSLNNFFFTNNSQTFDVYNGSGFFSGSYTSSSVTGTAVTINNYLSIFGSPINSWTADPSAGSYFTNDIVLDVTSDTELGETYYSGATADFAQTFIDGGIYNLVSGGLIPVVSAGSGSSSTVTIDNTSSNAVPVILTNPVSTDAVNIFCFVGGLFLVFVMFSALKGGV